MGLGLAHFWPNSGSINCPVSSLCPGRAGMSPEALVRQAILTWAIYMVHQKSVGIYIQFSLFGYKTLYLTRIYILSVYSLPMLRRF